MRGEGAVVDVVEGKVATPFPVDRRGFGRGSQIIKKHPDGAFGESKAVLIAQIKRTTADGASMI